MPSIRPSFARPTIRELKTFLFAPSRPCQRPQFPSRLPNATSKRAFSRALPLHAVKSQYRGPVSEETTQTDFGAMDVLGNTPVPSTSIDACLWDGFHLNSGVQVVGGKGVLLVGGEAFSWCPWAAAEKGAGNAMRLVNEKGQFELLDEAWGLLGLVWPKPDLLILGLGAEMRPIGPRTKAFINSLGIRIEIQDTRNAAAQFNLLSTERGVGTIAAALIPLGWRDGVGVK